MLWKKICTICKFFKCFINNETKRKYYSKELFYLWYIIKFLALKIKIIEDIADYNVSCYPFTNHVNFNLKK